ncbi:hypothetical protein KIN20_013030 [Parelaphostrongylus tenuis]|uniref:Uncharacterized protein n=1 Tax=Parelaphostrongylus tenuis TaxID=148309 RepID=A0AAD5MBJ0_PARTN|nr:hypothetical protein KIN20_013030 [Parelaphostrongylus tenuis]
MPPKTSDDASTNSSPSFPGVTCGKFSSYSGTEECNVGAIKIHHEDSPLSFWGYSPQHLVVLLAQLQMQLDNNHMLILLWRIIRKLSNAARNSSTKALRFVQRSSLFNIAMGHVMKQQLAQRKQLKI